MADETASQQIDSIIQKHAGWKGELIAQLRAVIHQADPEVVEEIKWKMASRPEGLPVWSHGGIVCFAEIWKDNVKLLFPKGPRVTKHKSLFNARLEGTSVRAIEYHESDAVDSAALKQLILEVLELNT